MQVNLTAQELKDVVLSMANSRVSDRDKENSKPTVVFYRDAEGETRASVVYSYQRSLDSLMDEMEEDILRSRGRPKE